MLTWIQTPLKCKSLVKIHDCQVGKFPVIGNGKVSSRVVLKTLVVVKRSVYRSWTSREPPFPIGIVSRRTPFLYPASTYHLEAVQFLLDLLSQHGRETVASGDFSTSVIFLRWPCIVKYNARTKRSIAFADNSLGCSRSTLCILAKSQCGHEVVLVADGDRISAFVTLGLVVRCAGCARAWRIGNVGNHWQLERGTLDVLSPWRRAWRVATSCWVLVKS